MGTGTRCFGLALVLCLLASPAWADDVDWSGTWATDDGAMTITQDGATVRVDYADNAKIQAEANGRKLTGTYQEGGYEGRIEWELDETGSHFKGKRIYPNGNSRIWRGWKQDPKAESKPAAKFAGHWVTSLGTFRLEQKGSAVSGPWRHQGWCSIKGTVKGARLNAVLKTQNWKGKAWLELTPDGKRIYGMTDETPRTAFQGVLVEGFEDNPKLKAGEIAQGRTENGLLYFARPPDGWSKGKAVDTIVLLHGSNWTTKGMVWVTAKNWPELAKNYMIVGIQGEDWSKYSEAPDYRFNYTYVNWVGKSTLKGFPYTHMESPRLVSDAVKELSEKYKWKRVFVGGHSQGGYLTFVLYMNYPELFAGGFPIAGGLIMQAEPDVFKDKKLRAAQRAAPLAIIHGSKDSVVDHSGGVYANDRFEGSGFPLTRFIDPPLDHGYDFLPVNKAIEHLDALTTTDAKVLAAYADKSAEAKQWRLVSAALVRAGALKARKKLAAAEQLLDAAALPEIERFTDLLKKGEAGDWVADFHAWRRQFHAAPGAAALMKRYNKLRAKHDPMAEDLVDAAISAFRQRDPSTGRAKYEELVKSYWASGRYRQIRRWLDNRK